MKKLIALLLCIVLTLSLISGCSESLLGEGEAKNDRKSSTSKDQAENTRVDESTTDSTNTVVGYTRGINASTGWKSEYMGLQFNPGSGMTMSSDEELLEMGDITAGAAVVYEMMATDTSGNNVIVNAEKMPDDTITEEYYASIVEEQLVGIGYTVGDPYSVTLWGKAFLAVDTSTTMYGIALSQYYLIYNMGDYMLCIIFTDATGTSLETFINCFSEY